MTAPRTPEEVFALIEQKEKLLDDLSDGPEYYDIVHQGIRDYAHLPFMQNVTPSSYYTWCLRHVERAREEERQRKKRASQIAPEQFFEAAYEYDPFGTATPSRQTPLVKLLVTDSVPPILLGKMDGVTPIWLAPRKNSLHISEISLKHFTSYEAADSDSATIMYADSHPSSDHEQGGSHYRQSSNSPDYDTLRRFYPIGYVAYRHSEHCWEYTGHVMVMDMDRGRDHHPWIVLVPNWPDLNGEGTNSDFLCRAPQRIKLDTPNVHGIFPGDTRRTTVAKFVHLGTSSSTLPFLKQFGPNFEFGLSRRGGETLKGSTAMDNEYHPDLPHVMEWYWDAQAKQEVCYAENGKEWRRYDPVSCTYSIP